jgi:hypothetical protein
VKRDRKKDTKRKDRKVLITFGEKKEKRKRKKQLKKNREKTDREVFRDQHKTEKGQRQQASKNDL